MFENFSAAILCAASLFPFQIHFSLYLLVSGQAFGVGALETEDSDIYAQDKLTDYDWEIGGGQSSDEDEEDAEQAELEAARTGRLSSGSRNSTKRQFKDSSRTLDGWTAPTLSHGTFNLKCFYFTHLLH